MDIMDAVRRRCCESPFAQSSLRNPGCSKVNPHLHCLHVTGHEAQRAGHGLCDRHVDACREMGRMMLPLST